MRSSEDLPRKYEMLAKLGLKRIAQIRIHYEGSRRNDCSDLTQRQLYVSQTSRINLMRKRMRNRYVPHCISGVAGRRRLQASTHASAVGWAAERFTQPADVVLAT